MLRHHSKCSPLCSGGGPHPTPGVLFALLLSRAMGTLLKGQLKHHLWLWTGSWSPCTLSGVENTSFDFLLSSLGQESLTPHQVLWGYIQGPLSIPSSLRMLLESLTLIPGSCSDQRGQQESPTFVPKPQESQSPRTADVEVASCSWERHPHPSFRILSHSFSTKASVPMHLC